MPKTKKISHKKIEVDKFTLLPIDTEREKYAILVECDGDKIFSVSFWRHEEMKNLIVGNLQKVSELLMKKMGQMAGIMMGGLRIG